MRSHVLRYGKYGVPSAVINVTHHAIEKLAPNDVLVKFMAAPINPSDYNQIEGKYPIKPALPAIGGNEGSATVIDIGNNVTTLKTGDVVLPASAGFGTWRTMCTTSQHNLRRIPGAISVAASAMLAVNPCTAYRMIEDFNKPPPGSWLIQNGANSGVGRSVIQLCKAQNIHTVNIIRDRENVGELKEELHNLGADVVYTSTQHKEIEQFCREQAPCLALNMLGGREVILLLKVLGKGGSMVTYGAMSNIPMSVPFGLMVFKDLQLHSYWMTRWTEQHSGTPLQDHMFGALADYFSSGELAPPPHHQRSMYDYADALDNAYKQKQLFVTDLTMSDSRYSGDD